MIEICKIFMLNFRSALSKFYNEKDNKYATVLNFGPRVEDGIVLDFYNKKRAHKEYPSLIQEHIGDEHRWVIFVINKNDNSFVYTIHKLRYKILDKASINDKELVNSIKNKIDGYTRSDKEKNRGICELTPEDVVKIINNYGAICDQCDKEVLLKYKPNCNRQYSIDRKNNDLPHTYNNCRLTCWACNRRDDKLALPANNKCDSCTDKDHEL